MAAPPKWHARLPEIRAALDALESPALDRAMVEELFALSRRQALRVMAAVHPHHKGRTSLIPRAALLDRLDTLLAKRPIQGEILRKRRLRETLVALECEAQSRSTPVTVPSADPSLPWPEGVSIPAPGCLNIRFSTGEELLGRVLALAEEAARDVDGFITRLESP